MGIFLENFKIAFNVNSLYLTYLPNNSMEGYKSCPVIKERNKKWTQALNIYEDFRNELFAYKQRQYQGWCEHVSDILAQNLTR